MNRALPIFLLCFAFFLSAHKSWASDTWVKSRPNSRHFVAIENDHGIIQVKLFHQIRGDYQDKVSLHEFKTFEEAREYIKKEFSDFKEVEKLEEWPVDTSLDTKKADELWTATNQWNHNWEQRYADWLKTEVTEDFYLRHNIAIDCADALIGYRWIFARIHNLPVANTVSSTGSLFGHFSMRKSWKNLPKSFNWFEDQAFIRALNYVMDMTSTRTIMSSDGFPVSITQKGLQAGTFIVNQVNGSGHMRTITQNYYDDPTNLPLFTMSSTAPRELRPLYKEAFVDHKWPGKKTKEILAFRWPVISKKTWILNPRSNDTRYSEEQFDTALESKYYSFIQFVLKRIHPNYDPNSLVTTGISDISNYTNIRIKIVRDGYTYCSSHDCRPGTQAWEDWSTPNRDAKYLVKFNEVEDLVKSFDPMYPGLLSHWLEGLDSTIMNVEGYDLSLSKLRSLFERKLPSHDPRDPILKRWGLE